MERKLEMASRQISALGPAPQQLKEGNLTQKKWVRRFLPFCYATLSKAWEEQSCPFWKGNIGMGQSGLCFVDTFLIILFPVSGTRRTFPEFQGRLVSRTALPDPACVHRCACSMCNSSRRTHTSRHTQTDIVHGQKTLRSFFFQTRIQLVMDRTRFQDWSWMLGMQVKLFQHREAISEAQEIFLSAVSYESV